MCSVSLILIGGALAAIASAPEPPVTTPAPTASVESKPLTPPDAASLGVIPIDHFSYDAIRTLGMAGLIQGYPEGTDVIQGRILTRIEMATLVARNLTFLANASVLPEKQRPAVRPEYLRLSQRLFTEFYSELKTIGYDFRRVMLLLPTAAQQATEPQPKWETVGMQVRSSQGTVDSTRKGDEASILGHLKERIAGYFQFRWDDIVGGDKSLFSTAGGEGQRPTTGGPSVGGPRSGMLIRRGRIRFQDTFTAKDQYSFTIDFPSYTSPNVRDAYIRLYDFPGKGFTFRAGQYAFPYGFEYIVSSRFRETPERSLGFSDSTQATSIYLSRTSSTGGVVTPGSVLPFFYDQDRDIGIELAWAAPKNPNVFVPRASLNVIQGEGRAVTGQRALNNIYDITGSVEAIKAKGKSEQSVGLSFYHGAMPVRSAAPATDGKVAPFRNAQRSFGGIYARYKLGGSDYRAEYHGGQYEVTPDRALYLDNNRFNAWYVTTRQAITPRLESYIKYDEFHPTSHGTVVGGVKGSDLARKTLQLGLMWLATVNEKGEGVTRFRINYEQGLTPYNPAAAAGTPQRDKLGLLQLEVQQSF